MLSKTFVIKTESGLHARPASLLAATTSKYASNITVEKNNRKANAKSVISLLSIGASKGESVTLKVEGQDEKEAMDVVENLFDKNFNE